MTGYKRFMVGIFVICIIITNFSLVLDLNAATVSSGKCGDNLSWTLDSNGTLTISGKGKMYDYSYLDNQALWGYHVKRIVIQNGVTSIGSHAFMSLQKVTDITIPDTVTDIGEYALDYCWSLESLVLPDTIKYIGYGAFQSCHSLEEITIPANVTDIDTSVFYQCTSLQNIYTNNKKDFSSVNGILYNENKTELLIYPPGKQDAHFTIPNTVTVLRGSCFSSANFKSITIPDSVTKIEDYAFSGCCNMESVAMPDSVKSLGKGVFGKCASLKEIRLPTNLYAIPEYLFTQCSSLETVTVSKNITEIGDWAFLDCYDLTTLYISDSLKHVGEGAFSKTGTFKVYYSGTKEQWNRIDIKDFNDFLKNANKVYQFDFDTVKVIASGKCGEDVSWQLDINGLLLIEGIGKMNDYSIHGVFAPWYNYRASIKSIYVDDTVSYMGTSAFNSCTNLKEVKLPYTIKNISAEMFYNCSSLIEIAIPGCVETIDTDAFNGCVNLCSVKLPYTLRFIGTDAFCTSDQLDEIYFAGSYGEWNKISVNSQNSCILRAKVYPYSYSPYTTFPHAFSYSFADKYEEIISMELPCKAIIDAGGTAGMTWDKFLKTLKKTANFKFIDDEKQLYEAIILEMLTNQVNSVNYKEEMLKSTKDFAGSVVDCLVSKGLDIAKANVDDKVAATAEAYSAMKGVKITTECHDILSKSCEGVDSYINKIAVYVAAKQSCTQYIEALKLMKQYSDNNKLTQALTEIIDKFQASDNSMILKIAASSGDDTVNEMMSSTITGIIGEIFPWWGMAVNGVVWTSDIIFPTYCLSDQKYRIYSLYTIEKASRAAMISAYDKYKSTASEDNAKRFISTYDMFIKVYEHEIKDLEVLAELLHKEGILNKIKNCFTGNDYEDYERALEWVAAYEANLDYIADFKVQAYNTWGMKVGKLKTLSIIGVSDGKYANVETKYYPVGETVELPDYSKLTKLDLGPFFTTKMKFEGWYYDEACTRECFSNTVTLNKSEKRYAKFTFTTGKHLEVKCPVDVEIITDAGDSVLKIENDKVVKNTLGLNVNIENSIKNIFLPNDDYYLIKINSRDDGKMNYSITEIQQGVSTKKINFYDISLYKGQVFNGNITKKFDMPYKLYSLDTVTSEDKEKTIQPNEYFIKDDMQNLIVSVTSEGNGTVSDGATVTRGDYFVVEAKNHSNSKFNGWYINGNLVSDDMKYCFQVKENTELVAKFVNISNSFPDVPNNQWYTEGVYYCANNGYIMGNEKGNFNPGGKLTREQFVVILARVAKAELNCYGGSIFDDVNISSWYGPSVMWSYNQGYVNGIGNGSKFGVGQDMTREQLATMFFRYADKNGVSTANKTNLSTVFSDYKRVSSWAREACEWAVYEGLLGSTNTVIKTLSPKMTVTRAQAAKIFMSYDRLK